VGQDVWKVCYGGFDLVKLRVAPVQSELACLTPAALGATP